jgi:hypothetical protein
MTTYPGSLRYYLDDPLEGAVFSVMVEIMKTKEDKRE